MKSHLDEVCLRDHCKKQTGARGLCPKHYGEAYRKGRFYQQIEHEIKKRVRVQKPLTTEQLLKARVYGIRSRAAKKEVDFDLTVDDVARIIQMPCEYCGAEPLSELDRKIPADGYVLSNIAPACHRCNTLKSNVITYEEMIKVVKALGWRKSP